MEVIGVIQNNTKAYFEKAEQHWHYCRRGEKLPGLNNHGALQTVEKTTTNRIGVKTDKLVIWHGTTYETLNELDFSNSWHEDW